MGDLNINQLLKTDSEASRFFLKAWFRSCPPKKFNWTQRSYPHKRYGNRKILQTWQVYRLLRMKTKGLTRIQIGERYCKGGGTIAQHIKKTTNKMKSSEIEFNKKYVKHIILEWKKYE